MRYTLPLGRRHFAIPWKLEGVFPYAIALRQIRSAIADLAQLCYHAFMITRSITPKVLELSRKFPVVAITGPRQSGKTTLIRNIFPDYRYFNLENPMERNFALEDPQGFLAQSKKMVIDEVQRVPELFSYIQVIVDDDPQLKIIISVFHNFKCWLIFH